MKRKKNRQTVTSILCRDPSLESLCKVVHVQMEIAEKKNEQNIQNSQFIRNFLDNTLRRHPKVRVAYTDEMIRECWRRYLRLREAHVDMPPEWRPTNLVAQLSVKPGPATLFKVMRPKLDRMLHTLLQTAPGPFADYEARSGKALREDVEKGLAVLTLPPELREAYGPDVVRRCVIRYLVRDVPGITEAMIDGCDALGAKVVDRWKDADEDERQATKSHLEDRLLSHCILSASGSPVALDDCEGRMRAMITMFDLGRNGDIIISEQDVRTWTQKLARLDDMRLARQAFEVLPNATAAQPGTREVDAEITYRIPHNYWPWRVLKEFLEMARLRATEEPGNVPPFVNSGENFYLLGEQFLDELEDTDFLISDLRIMDEAPLPHPSFLWLLPRGHTHIITPTREHSVGALLISLVEVAGRAALGVDFFSHSVQEGFLSTTKLYFFDAGGVPRADDPAGDELYKNTLPLILKILASMAAAPKIVECEAVEKSRPPKKGKRGLEFRTPRVIGWKVRYIRTAGGHRKRVPGAPPAPHWRRRHIRRVPYGPTNIPLEERPRRIAVVERVRVNSEYEEPPSQSNV